MECIFRYFLHSLHLLKLIHIYHAARQIQTEYYLLKKIIQSKGTEKTEQINMAKSDSRYVFDDLYTDFCNSLRETGKASSFCQLIKNANSDLNRIRILTKESNIVPSFVQAVSECVGNNSKNSVQAKEILELYYANKDKFGESEDNLIQLLNSALVHVQIEKELEFEDFEKDNIISFLENLLVDNLEESSSLEGTLLSEIFRERANYFYNRGEYEISLMDSLRGIFYGQINKNSPGENIFPLLVITGTSLRNLGHLEVATNVLQFSVKLLRKSSLDNAAKSLETVKLVKLMKEIQTLSKERGNSKQSLNLTSFLERRRQNIPKLFQGSSDILIGASNTLQLKWQADRGRHVVAKKTVPAGSTIIVEHPFSWVVHPKESLVFCQNCCQEAKNLIPCKKCSSVVFCSKQCRMAAEEYHQYECQFLKSLTSSEILGDMALLCYRSISKTDLRILESHIREYTIIQEKILEEDSLSKEDEKVSQMKFILGLDPQGKLDSTGYTSVFAQTTNSELRLSGDLLKRSFSAVYLTLCLRFSSYFQIGEEENLENCNLTETEELIASLLLRHLQSASCNAYGINNISGCDPRRLQIKEIGGATYPIISTTNHSCNSNVYRYSVGNVCIVKALREIQAGEEILDSYGPHFASSNCEERMRYLDGQYLFKCSCFPCTENWPVYSKLPRENICFKCPRCGNESTANGKDKHMCSKCSNVFDIKKILKIVKGSERQFIAAKEILLNPKNNGKSEIDYEAAQNSIAHYVSILGKIQKWPCQALVECQEALKLCWNLENRN